MVNKKGGSQFGLLSHREPLRSEGLDEDGLAGAGEVGGDSSQPPGKKLTSPTAGGVQLDAVA